MRVLVIDDDVIIRTTVAEVLISNGFDVDTLDDGAKLDVYSMQNPPDIYIVDENMPGIKGRDVIRRLRTAQIHSPVIMLSGVEENGIIADALMRGADDYVVKPFDPSVFVARVRAVARRSAIIEKRTEALDWRTLGKLHFDDGQHQVFVGGARVHLTLTEFKALECLLKSRGQVIPRADLANHALGTTNVTMRSVDVHICSLRKKLRESECVIESVRGRGYKIVTA